MIRELMMRIVLDDTGQTPSRLSASTTANGGYFNKTEHTSMDKLREQVLIELGSMLGVCRHGKIIRGRDQETLAPSHGDSSWETKDGP